jgi:hypothetical protein
VDTLKSSKVTLRRIQKGLPLQCTERGNERKWDRICELELREAQDELVEKETSITDLW